MALAIRVPCNRGGVLKLARGSWNQMFAHLIASTTELGLCNERSGIEDGFVRRQ
jgi:hypothetical protein